METRANYVAIGTFVMLVLLGVLGALYWLYRSADPGASAVVRIIFTEPVTGLSTGGSVLFNGIRVGEVSQLRFAPGGGDDVIAFTRISQNAPIKDDTVAKLGFQGLTGVAYISLTGGSEEAPSLFADGNDVPTIRAETSAFTNVLDSAQSVLQRVNTTLNEVNTFLGDNRTRLDEVVTNVTELTGTLNQAAPQVSGLITDIASAGRAVATAAPQITSVVDRANTLLGAIEPNSVSSIVENVDEFTGTLPRISAQAEAIVGNAGGLVTRLNDTAGTLGEAVAAVRDVVNGIDKDAVGAIVANVRTATGVLASRANEIGTVIDDVAAISGDVRTVSRTVADRSGEIGDALDGLGGLLTDARQAVASAAPAIERFGNALDAVTPQRVEAIVTSVERITTDVAAQMPQLNSLISSATKATGAVADLTERLLKRADIIDTAMVDASEFMKNLREASTDAPKIVASIEGSANQLGEVLNAIDPVAIEGIVNNANRFSGTLAAQDERIGTLLANTDQAVQSIEGIASSLALRMPQIGDIIQRVDETTASVQVFAASLPEFAGTLRPGIENVAQVMSSIDPATIDALVSDAKTFVEGLAEQRGPIAELLADAGKAMRGIDTVTTSLAESAPQIRAIITDVEGAMGPVRAFADELPRLAEALKPGVENASDVLAAIDPAAVSGIIDSAASFAEMLAAQNAHVSSLITSADATVQRVEAISSALAIRMPQIGAVIDGVEATAQSAQRFAAALPEFAETLKPGVDNVSEVLQAVDPAAISGLVDSAGQFAGMLGSESETVRQILTDAKGATADANRILGTVAEKTPQIGAAIDSASKAATSAETFAAGLPELLARLEPGIDNVANVLSAIDPEVVKQLVANVDQVAKVLGEQAPKLESIISAVDRASTNAATITERLSGEMGRVSAILEDTQVTLVNAREFAAGLPVLLNELKPGLINASEALGAIDPNAVAEIVENARSLTATLRASEGEITAIIASASKAMNEVEGVAAAVSGRIDQIDKIITDAASFAGNLSTVGPQLESLASGATGALDAVRNTVSAVNAGAINEIVSNVRRVAEVLGSRAGEVGTAIDNATAAAKGLSEGLGTLGGSDGTLAKILEQAKHIGTNLEGASDQVKVVVQRVNNLLDGPVQGMVGNVSAAATDIREVAAAFASRAGQIAGGLARFSTGGLDDLRAVLNQGRSTLSAIETAVSSFDRDPSRVIFGGSDGPRYTPQRR